jgi:hypothetical protein
MKTHDIARSLEQLAAFLRAAPNMQLSDASLRKGDHSSEVRMRDIAVNLSTLAELSRLNKREWQGVITHYALPVPIKTTDSTRDLLGRLLNYLEKNPQERERLRKEASPSSAEASPELLRAFKVLLNE